MERKRLAFDTAILSEAVVTSDVVRKGEVKRDDLAGAPSSETLLLDQTHPR